MEKRIGRGIILIAAVIAHICLSRYYPAGEWISYILHFSIGGMLTAWAIAPWAEKWIEIAGYCTILGVVWEIFEYWVFQGGTSNQAHYYVDTIWDLQMNFFGVVVYLFFASIRSFSLRSGNNPH